MSSPLPVLAEGACWHLIGVWGDRSCPELATVTHCHNCPVFATAGRRFLDAPSPRGYLEEWTARLAPRELDATGEDLSLLVFRLGDEWLALPVGVLVEVTRPRPPHRIPHRAGLLSGLVNIRGELHLCVRLDQLLGVTRDAARTVESDHRLIVIRRDGEGWTFAADEVDQVRRLSVASVAPPAPTLSRASAKLTRGVFREEDRSVGILEESSLFKAIRERMR